MEVGVLVISDRVASGEAQDKSGIVAVDILKKAFFNTLPEPRLRPCLLTCAYLRNEVVAIVRKRREDANNTDPCEFLVLDMNVTTESSLVSLELRGSDDVIGGCGFDDKYFAETFCQYQGHHSHSILREIHENSKGDYEPITYCVVGQESKSGGKLAEISSHGCVVWFDKINGLPEHMEEAALMCLIPVTALPTLCTMLQKAWKFLRETTAHFQYDL